MESINILGLIIAGGSLGMVLTLGTFMELTRRHKARRFIAEFRRRERLHRAELDCQKRAHDAETAALRDHIRLERTTMRPHAAIEASAIETRRILNRDEFALFARLESLVAGLPNGQRLFSQVSLLEVFHARALNGDPKTRLAAFEAYKAFRVDFLIVNRAGYPVLGIEHQGSGHHQGNAAYRDQIKREVFRKAGVPLIEVPADYDWPRTEQRLREALRAPQLATPPPSIAAE